MSIETKIVAAAILLAVIGIGILSGKQVKNTGDFINGGSRAGHWLVCGTIMGSLVGSQATIGTAQLAFHYGLSAWWFTLGSGIGCLILALLYEKRLRASGCITEVQIIAREYGDGTGSLASLLCSTGIFISVLSQLTAGIGLMSVLTPELGDWPGALICALIMGVYIVLGGSWGAGMVGVMKVVLLSAVSVLSLVVVFHRYGSLHGLIEALYVALSGSRLGLIQEQFNLSPLSDNRQVYARFFSLFSRGYAKDIGSALSLILGVLSTQTYSQAIWSAKSDSEAKKGALLSACLIPPLGAAGIAVGLYMRTVCITQGEAAALLTLGEDISGKSVISSTLQVFPLFVVRSLPPLLAGLAMSALLLTVIAGGAGLSLGMATILVRDLLRKKGSSSDLLLTRLVLALILLAATLCAAFLPRSTINDLGFLSMGLRATVIFLPLCFALWAKGKVNSRCARLSIIFSPLCVLISKMLFPSAESLWAGMAVSSIFFLVGTLLSRKRCSIFPTKL